MNSGSAGSFNRLIYDNCATQKYYHESTSPLKWQLYHGKFEHCEKCRYDGQFWTPYELVDIETELRNQNRPLSHCDQFKYNPSCKSSSLCLSTFDSQIPVVLAPEVCPIVHNNIRRWGHPGYSLQDPKKFCNGKNNVSKFELA